MGFMQGGFIIAIFIFFSGNSFAQKILLKKDTIFSGKTPYALWEQGKKKPVRHFIHGLDGKKLIELHDSRTDIKGKPGYVLTFLDDQKQCMVIKDAAYPVSLFKELTKYNLMCGDTTANREKKQAFIAAHPLPDGYHDVEQFIEYWKEDRSE